jgi:serine/threonine protein phosphatase PrpC
VKVRSMASETDTTGMVEVQYASLSHIGASPKRKLLEDRSRAVKIQTAGGLSMTLGIVSDGVGGENAGERAAELTVQTILDQCRQSTSTDIPEILRTALEEANDRVYGEARHSARKMNMGATAAVASIHEGKLYLANVGDSRIYLIRDGKTIPLTIDHTWMNEVVREGKLSPQEARKHPRRDEIVRAIGNEAFLKVDLGVWLQGGKETEEEARSAQGLPLFPGDRVLICSDGVIKSRLDQPEAHYVEEHEFYELVYGLDPGRAVKAILKLARSRQVDDNVSAVILEIPSGSRPIRLPGRRIFLLAAIVPLLLVGVNWLIVRSFHPSPEVPSLPEIPSLPSGFAFLSLLEGSAEKQALGGEFKVLHAEDIIPSGLGIRIRTVGDQAYLRLDLADGSILYLGPNTQIEFRAIANGSTIHETLIVLEQGQVLVVHDGSSEHAFAVTSTIGVTARIAGSVMGVQLESAFKRLHLDCFQGICSIEEQRRYVLTSGQHIWMDITGDAGPMGPARNELYAFGGAWIAETIAVTQVTPTIGTPQPTKTLGPLFLTPTFPFTPTKTARPRRTAIPPTQIPTDTLAPTDTEEPPTLTPTHTSEPTDTPTHTPMPSPTHTETQKPTETPKPSSTSAETPSDTPLPTQPEGG